MDEPRVLSEADRKQVDLDTKAYFAELELLREHTSNAVAMVDHAFFAHRRDHMDANSHLAAPDMANSGEVNALIHRATLAMKAKSKTLIYVSGGETKAAIKFLLKMTGVGQLLTMKVLLDLREANPNALWAMSRCTHPMIGGYTQEPERGKQLDIHTSQIDGSVSTKYELRSLEDLKHLIGSGYLSNAPLITICGDIPLLGKNVSLWFIPSGIKKTALPKVNAYIKHVLTIVDKRLDEDQVERLKKTLTKGSWEGRATHFVAVMAKDQGEAEEIRKDLHGLEDKAELMLIPRTKVAEWVGDLRTLERLISN